MTFPTICLSKPYNGLYLVPPPASALAALAKADESQALFESTHEWNDDTFVVPNLSIHKFQTYPLSNSTHSQVSIFTKIGNTTAYQPAVSFAHHLSLTIFTQQQARLKPEVVPFSCLRGETLPPRCCRYLKPSF